MDARTAERKAQLSQEQVRKGGLPPLITDISGRLTAGVNRPSLLVLGVSFNFFSAGFVILEYYKIILSMIASRILLSISAFAIAVMSSTSSLGQEADARVRAAIEAQDWNSARTEIEKLRTADPSLFSSKSYDYLLGRVAENSGDVATAVKNYQQIVTNNGSLSAYALWHMARLARSTGDLVLERERLRQLINLGQDQLLHDAANLRLVESYFESGDNPATIAAANKFIQKSQKPALVREISLMLADAYLRDGKSKEANDVFNQLLMKMPDASRPDDFALAAVRELDQLAQSRVIDIPLAQLTEADHLLRASVYQFNRDFAGARNHYQAVINANPQSGAVPNATYQLGRGLYLEGKYEEALKVFQRVVDQFPQSQSARDALPLLAASYLRLKRVDDAIEAYKLFISRFPDAPNPERPYLNIIDALHENGRYPEALNWIQQTRTRFKTDLGGALALFAQLRIHLAQASWLAVTRDADELLKFPDLGGTKVGGGTTQPEVTFLKAVALEQLGRTEEAISSYLTIPDGRNEYYGNRATQRLAALSANEKARALVINRYNALAAAAKTSDTQNQFEQARVAAQSAIRLTDDKTKRADLIEILRRAYEASSAYRLPKLQLVSLNPGMDSNHSVLGETLFGLGLYDEAMPEIFAGRDSTQRSTFAASDDSFTLAVYSLRGGLPNRSVRFAEQVWKTVPADYVLEAAPRDLVELLYPAPFRQSLLKHASSRNVDPRFVLSIIRQESRYQADVKSVSAARGMMQFIAATANEIATQLNLKSFSQDDLYSPDTAILFGSQYLANLFKQFPGQPQAVAGSYNGGADNLSRWIARSKSIEADRYVPEIGFSQTKDYVYKVMSNYWNYERLYDDKLQPNTK
jgi:soluble lytic murein transglycosylase